MQKKSSIYLYVGLGLCLVSVLYTVMVMSIDRENIGPELSAIGFSTLNEAIFTAIGVHMSLYTLTEILGFIPLGVALAYLVFGIVEWVRKKSLKKVDFSLILLGIFYVVLAFLYFALDKIRVNYRPVLINGALESSYPSTHTMLTTFIMISSMMVLRRFTSNKAVIISTDIISVLLTVVIVTCRFLSGVHWFTDILGGLLIASSLLLTFKAFLLINNDLGSKAVVTVK
jgi:membrane-associated phospholipid phosphatase